MIAIEKALHAVMLDEGLRLEPYKCTAGALTIGYGRNLDSRGISLDEAELMLRNDLRSAEADARACVSVRCWDSLDSDRQSALINMAFNLGRSRLLRFVKFREALESLDFEMASREMLDSRWARQVGERAVRLAAVIDV